MATKDNSRDRNDERKQGKGRKQDSQGDQKKCNKREESGSSIGKKRWSNLGRIQSGIYGSKNLCTKQQEDQGGNLEREP